MNNKVKRMPGDFDGFGWQYKAVVPVFSVVLAVIDFVLKFDFIAKPLFDNVRGEERCLLFASNQVMLSFRTHSPSKRLIYAV